MLNKIRKNMNKKGFTLVELIIVLAVMAILAAIVVPRMTGVTNSFKVRADERTAAALGRELELRIQTGEIASASNIEGDVTEHIADTKAPQSGGKFTYAYDATAKTLTISVADSTITTPAFKDVVISNVSAIK